MSLSITRQTDGYLLEAELRIERPREEVFAFFADARNLETLTPDSLRFQILTPAPIEMREGALIDYRLSIRGVPVAWQSEITVWDPPQRFVDEQRRGPYRWWRHEHLFAESGAATRIEDRVSYGVPGGALVHKLFVAREVAKIFRYRHTRIAQLIAPEEPAPDPASAAAGGRGP